jgi:hypothetical protein
MLRSAPGLTFLHLIIYRCTALPPLRQLRHLQLEAARLGPDEGALDLTPLSALETALLGQHEDVEMSGLLLPDSLQCLALITAYPDSLKAPAACTISVTATSGGPFFRLGDPDMGGLREGLVGKLQALTVRGRFARFAVCDQMLDVLRTVRVLELAGGPTMQSRPWSDLSFGSVTEPIRLPPAVFTQLTSLHISGACMCVAVPALPTLERVVISSVGSMARCTFEDAALSAARLALFSLTYKALHGDLASLRQFQERLRLRGGRLTRVALGDLTILRFVGSPCDVKSALQGLCPCGCCSLCIRSAEVAGYAASGRWPVMGEDDVGKSGDRLARRDVSGAMRQLQALEEQPEVSWDPDQEASDLWDDVDSWIDEEDEEEEEGVLWGEEEEEYSEEEGAEESQEES